MQNKNKQRRERFVLQEINEAAEIVIKAGGKPKSILLGCEEATLLAQSGGLAKLQRAGFALKFSEHERELEVG
jgi:hypothetical protein